MARLARQQSEHGIYHVILRGNDQKQLFYDDEDRQAFLARVERYKGECGFMLYAYCLMGNHIHLLIGERDTGLSVIMKKLTLSYSCWFNDKYDRSGFLYQGRYKSEPVDDDTYLLSVLRYIHLNPVRVGGRIDSWTSYREYVGKSQLVDTGFILCLFDPVEEKAKDRFREFMHTPSDDGYTFLEGEAKRQSDDKAIEAIKHIAGVTTCSALADLDKEVRNHVLALLKAEGLTVRQIARLTGINRGIVQRAHMA